MDGSDRSIIMVCLWPFKTGRSGGLEIDCTRPYLAVLGGPPPPLARRGEEYLGMAIELVPWRMGQGVGGWLGVLV